MLRINFIKKQLFIIYIFYIYKRRDNKDFIMADNREIMAINRTAAAQEGNYVTSDFGIKSSNECGNNAVCL